MYSPFSLAGASADLSSTLLPGEIPAKLRCGLCNLVAVNAVKLPCCETSICDKCKYMRSNHQQVRMLTVVNKQAKQDFQKNVPSASTNRCRPTFAQQ
jgi:hypothetical protein